MSIKLESIAKASVDAINGDQDATLYIALLVIFVLLACVIWLVKRLLTKEIAEHKKEFSEHKQRVRDEFKALDVDCGKKVESVLKRVSEVDNQVIKNETEIKNHMSKIQYLDQASRSYQETTNKELEKIDRRTTVIEKLILEKVMGSMSEINANVAALTYTVQSLKEKSMDSQEVAVMLAKMVNAGER